MVRTFLLCEDGSIQTDVDLLRLELKEKDRLWVDIDDSSGDEGEALLRDAFHFHPLAIEDCLQPLDAPKVDHYEGYSFLVIHAPDPTGPPEELLTVELDLFLGQNFLVTYHQQPLRSITTITAQCERDPGQLLERGLDFLLHRILDALVDNYKPILDQLGPEIEQIEDDVMEVDRQGTLALIGDLRKSLLRLRQTISAQRDVMSSLSRQPSRYITVDALPYFRDVYDQLAKFSDTSTLYRDSLAGARATYLSAVSNRTNEIMRMLTLIATIMMPLTFITGIYGMNFRFMPEMNTLWGYPAALLLMLGVAVGMVVYFKRKKWF